MKASELVKKLQELIEEHGDCNAEVVDSDYLSPYYSIEVTSIYHDDDRIFIE